MNLSLKPIEDMEDDFAVMAGKVREFNSFPDGGVEILIKIDPSYHEIADYWFNETEATVAIARLKPEALQENESLSK